MSILLLEKLMSDRFYSLIVVHKYNKYFTAYVPCEGVVYLLDKFKIADSITSQCWMKVFCELTKLFQMRAKFNVRYVVDDIQ